MRSAATKFAPIHSASRDGCGWAEGKRYEQTFGETPKGTGESPVLPGKFDVRGLISRRLEKKGRFSRHFSPLTTLISRY